MAVHKRRAVAGADMLDGAAQGGKAFEKVGAVALLKVEVGEVCHQRTDVAARRLVLDRDGDGVAVVLDDIEQRKLALGSRVDRLPELALRGGPFSAGDVGDLVGVMLHILELAIIAIHFGVGCRVTGEVEPGLGTAHGLQKLGSGGRRGGEDIVLAAAPVRRHLAATGCRIGGSTDGLQEHGFRGHTQGEAQGAVAIVGEKPVVTGAQIGGGGQQQGFMSGTGDLKENLLLAFEHDFAVIDAPRKIHEPIDLQQLLRDQSLVSLFCRDPWLALYNSRRHSRVPSLNYQPLRLDAETSEPHAHCK